jgi:ribosome maturation factor RimP
MGLRAHFFSKGVELPTTYDKERILEREIAPRVERDLPGVDVLAVELVSPGHFCVYVDHPNGVDHALCGRVTDVLRDYLRDYTVDVSSPGSERPLRRPDHFARFVGRCVKMRTVEKRFRGELLAADADHVTLGFEDRQTEIPYDEIVRANLIDEGA